ncbi:lipid-A-disaccharide synthase [Hydrogenophaga sp.]|uniref:lipid-A-disaccharide synthase n=1 Tax=Hydrogenophaga sp. TaxID=1904254 RepID=UPI00356389DE
MSGSKRLAMVAGEASGDLLAGLLLGGLRQRWPDLQTQGIGGARMREHGFDAWWSSDKLAVRGYIEVLRHYREIVGIRKQLRERLLQSPRPDLFIGVDAPDFNLELEADLKAQGVPTVHFVCPSIWAWRPERVDQIRRSVDHVLCLFPFEPELLARHGIAATYVGHPLAEVIPMEPDRQAARRALGLSDEDTVVALLPGSRASELAYLGPLFMQAAQRMQTERPGLRFVLPAVPALRARIDALVAASGCAPKVLVLDGQSHQALAACDATLIASGTATLEAALFKRPMVIAYNMNWISWQIMRRKQLQPWVGLPNILCQDFVVPELLQQAASPEALARSVLDWLDSPERMATVQQRFTTLHQTLRRPTAMLATDAIEKILER